MQNNRARIFLPMDALKGFNEALREKEIVKEPRKILLDDALEEIANKLLELKENSLVLIKYYDIYNYAIIKGKVGKINYIYKYLYVDSKKINFSDILDIVIC